MTDTKPDDTLTIENTETSTQARPRKVAVTGASGMIGSEVVRTVEPIDRLTSVDG